MSEVYETIRVREGRLPFLAAHLARLGTGAAALGLAVPADLAERLKEHVNGSELVLRVSLGAAGVRIEQRAVPHQQLVNVIIATVKHVPYRLKTDQREAFELARTEAQDRGAHEALLETRDGYLAEGTITAVAFWAGELLLPDIELGILPSVGRARLMELARESGFAVREGRWRREAWNGLPLVLVNSVRGVMAVETLQGHTVPHDPRTAVLATGFWPSTP